MENRDRILRIAAAHGAGNVRLIGPPSRHRTAAEGRLELLVDLEPGRSILDRAALLVELEGLLGCKVDVATERGLRARVRDGVLREARPI